MPDENTDSRTLTSEENKQVINPAPELEISSRSLPGNNPAEKKTDTENSVTNSASSITPKGENTSQTVTAPKDEPLEDTFPPDYVPPQDVKKSNKKIFILAFIVIVITSIAAILFFTLFNKDRKAENQSSESGQIQETESPPTTIEEASESFDRTKITLEVLNGSGVAGAAKKIADSLTSLGYNIITVGNAPEEIDQTQILISESLKKYEKEFLKDVNESLTEASTSGTLEDSTASARITIGKN